MSPRFGRRGATSHALLACALILAGAQVSLAEGATKAVRKTTSTSVRFIDAPSSESTANREKRLKRECRGRPNAGMCLGFTR